ncbi:MAG: xylB [Acidimicrobiales bacterium]|nr:xylB [Acidimicrobiales bacterium]
MAFVVGVDSSTQSTKVEIRELESGRVVGRGSAPHPPTHPPRSEQPPDAWWAAFETALAAAQAEAGVTEFAAISIAGQQHGMVVLDAAGQVIRDAKLWNDTETAPDAGWLLKQLPGGAADWAEACGSVPVAAFTIAKLSWLHRSEPENWARVAKVVLPHDWLTSRLTGALTTDRGDASGTGYWSAATGQYRWDLLSIIDADRDWTDVVPRVLDPLESAGTWRGAVVGPGTGDNMAAALGLGLRPGDVAMSFGTSGTVFAATGAPTADATGAVAGFADAAGGYLPLVCTLNATKVTDTVARLLGVDAAGLDALALQSPLGADGLTLLPYLDGERTPNRPKAKGWLTGLTSDASRPQLARAAVEGVVCALLDGLDALRNETGAMERVIMIGGGSRSAAYRQVLADLCELPVCVADADQAVAAGACVQAAAVLEQADPGDITARWGLGGGATVERSADGNGDRADSVRAAYAALRDGTA